MDIIQTLLKKKWLTRNRVLSFKREITVDDTFYIYIHNIHVLYIYIGVSGRRDFLGQKKLTKK